MDSDWSIDGLQGGTYQARRGCGAVVATWNGVLFASGGLRPMSVARALKISGTLSTRTHAPERVCGGA